MSPSTKGNPGAAATAAPVSFSAAGPVPGIPAGVSRCISSLRLPLMLGPVLVHACLQPARSPLQFVLARILGDVAVPAFFFIAGLLYFATFDGTPRNWLRKLQRRIYSLGVPYLVWNLIAYFVFAYAIHVLAKSDFPQSFWAVRVARRGVATAPADGPLYFLKGLFFLAIGAPAIDLALRRRWLAWFAPAVLAFWVAAPVPALADRMLIVALAFFATGGFVIRGRAEWLVALCGGKPARIAAPLAFAAIAAANLALHLAGLDFAPLRRLGIVAGVPAAFALASLVKGRAAALLARAQGFAMFLYCSFDIVLVYARRRWRATLAVPDDATCLLCAALAIAVPLAAYLILSLVAPWLSAILTGNRARRHSRA